jgi:transposase InsO family protein
MRITFIGQGLLGYAKLCQPQPSLSQAAKLRLKWLDYYHEHGNNASLACRHFGISRKTFYKWLKRYDRSRLASLESQGRAPKRTRQREITGLQLARVIQLRKQYICYGKEKLAYLYQRQYQEKISAWKIQKVIEGHKLYGHPRKAASIRRKRQRSFRKKRITELKQKRISGFLLQADTIVLCWKGLKRYILTAIDKYSKIAFARAYAAHSSYQAEDFLYRLNYLLDGKINNLQTDNGSEFLKHFDKGCQELNINHYFSRNHTPKDNAVLERFNRTLQEEFLRQGNFHLDLQRFNQVLTEWLVEYNFHRPHQALGYIPPINFQAKYLKVLPMYPSST